MRIVGGDWGGRRISAPAGRETRPTADRVREAWMSALSAEIPGATVLDLFSGSGALGLEALSRGASHVTFVENSPVALRSLEQNIANLQAPDSKVRVVRTDAMRYVEKVGARSFDLTLADPPYDRAYAGRLVELFVRTPFSGLLCIEHAPQDSLGAVEPVWQRRYGDTMLTFFRASDA